MNRLLMQSLLETQRVLLSPHEFSDLDTWRSEASSHLKRLTNASKATFYLPIEGVKAFHSDDLPSEFADQWQRHVRHVARTHRVLKKAEHQAVFTRRSIFADDPDAYYKSDTFNQVLRPAGIYDSAGMHCTRLDGGEQALVFVHFDRRNDRSTENAASVLRLLRPSAMAGISGAETVRIAADEVCTLIDRLDLGVQVHSTAGHLLYENARFMYLLKQSTSFAALLERSFPPTPHAGAPAQLRFKVDQSSYRMTRQQVRHWNSLLPDVVVTIVEPADRSEPDVDHLRGVFGLTPREAEIALYLAKRLTNKEITTLTGVRECTIRRHTEAVLSKLEIHSRHDVSTRIEEATNGRC
jgi:DNA-binding CsgD family transcriptional regulator